MSDDILTRIRKAYNGRRVAMKHSDALVVTHKTHEAMMLAANHWAMVDAIYAMPVLISDEIAPKEFVIVEIAR